MANVSHKNLTGANLHVPGYNQSAPGPTTPGPGMFWIDTSYLVSTGYVFLKVRNSTDSGWLSVACPVLISADGVYSASAQQIRQHIDDVIHHRIINDSSALSTELWSAAKIIASVLNPYTAHAATATIHRSINDGGSAATDLWSAAKIIAQLALKQNNVAPGQLVPPGTIIPYAGDGAPAGYIQCLGGTISRTTHAALFSVIGVKWGQGDGSTTFRVPDLAGRFLRGGDYGTGRDPDRASRTACNYGGAVGDAIGSVQGHQFASHTHPVGHLFGWATWGDPRPYWTAPTDFTQTTNVDTADLTTAAGGNETRPLNAFVNFCIKY